MSANEQAEMLAVYARRIMTLEKGYDELRTVNNRLIAKLEERTAEIERLRKIIADAPHDDTCDWRLYDKPCNCFKSEAGE